MCKTKPHRTTSCPLSSCDFGCDYGVTQVPIGVGVGFGTALGLGLGLRGPDLGLGLDNIIVPYVRALALHTIKIDLINVM